MSLVLVEWCGGVGVAAISFVIQTSGGGGGGGLDNRHSTLSQISIVNIPVSSIKANVNYQLNPGKFSEIC